MSRQARSTHAHRHAAPTPRTLEEERFPTFLLPLSGTFFDFAFFFTTDLTRLPPSLLGLSGLPTDVARDVEGAGDL